MPSKSADTAAGQVNKLVRTSACSVSTMPPNKPLVFSEFGIGILAYIYWLDRIMCSWAVSKKYLQVSYVFLELYVKS